MWKHLPLDIHPNAMDAHMAAMAALRQGKFWEFHDKVFANQQELTLNAYTRYARELGLDVARFEKDLADPESQKRIEADAAEARSIGVTGTPTFFVNGRFLSGAQPFEEFGAAIDAELARLNLPVPAEAPAS